MLKKSKHIIPLFTTDILENKTLIEVVGTNELYKNTRYGRSLTPKGKKYKQYINNQVERLRKELKLQGDQVLDEEIVLFVRFYLTLPLSKNGSIDKRYIRDDDNLMKPLKDSLQTSPTKIGLWTDDKIIRGGFVEIMANRDENERIELAIYKRDEKLEKRLDAFF